LHELFSTIVHQGTRYSATAPAVPFLVELATAPDTHDRAWLVNLLAYAAVGHEEAVLPDGMVSLDRLRNTTNWPEPGVCGVGAGRLPGRPGRPASPAAAARRG
jgi:hypothetical protein